MKLETIVIGEDFSEPSLAAARWVARQFTPQAKLVLVHAIEIPHPPSFIEKLVPAAPDLVEVAREGAEHRLRELAAELDRGRVRFEIRVGSPSERIAEVAESVDADLIVVGEHGHHYGFGDFLGSSAERLARSAPAPVLLARRLPPGPPRRVLLPIEESELLRDALAWGRFLAERFEAKVVAFYAVSPMIFGRIRTISMGKAERNIERELIQGAADWLRTQLRDAGLDEDSAEVQVTIGNPAHEITAAAERFGAELIVMPSRTSGTVGEALIGSTARAVLRSAPCPVLVVNRSGGRQG